MPPRVVIIGGGFGGLWAARALRRAPVDVLVIDRRNHHVFQPLLYQVATAGLSPAEISSPIRWLLRRQKHTRVWLAEATRIDTASKTVHLADGAVTYDYLILAAGAAHAYFGHDEWRPHAPGLKTLDDAIDIRTRVLLAFERAERATDRAEQARLLTFAVVGGGPTGVELAGALAEISRHALANDFRAVHPESARIVLLEGGADLLGTYPEPLRARARLDLERLGVQVRTNAPVTAIEAGVVQAGADRIETGTVLWAAGVAASPLGASLGVPMDRAGRVFVNEDLTVPGRPDVYVVGDLAAFRDAQGAWLPGVAQVAMQQATHAARNIRRTIDGQARTPFRYRNYGMMATIGRHSAVGDFGRVRLHGYLGWLAWLFVHVFQLIGFRNRFAVMTQWAYAYFTYQRAVRLITGDDHAR